MNRLAALASLVVLGACDPAAPPAHLRQMDQVRERERALIAAIVAEDAAAASGFYAPDAQVFLPFQAARSTPEAVRSGFRDAFDDPNGMLTLTPRDLIVTSSGDYAISQGAFLANYTDPQTHQLVRQSGNYVMLWRRQDDRSWTITRDISTPSGPIEVPFEGPPASEAANATIAKR